MVFSGGHAWFFPGEACVVFSQGACMVFSGGHAWFFLGGMHGFFWGCGGVRGFFLGGGHVWFFLGGMHGFFWGACIGYDEIWSMSVRYASYWNAFLLTRGSFTPND